MGLTHWKGKVGSHKKSAYERNETTNRDDGVEWLSAAQFRWEGRVVMLLAENSLNNS